jgi:DNA-binding XRE family transcriptional regulator
MNTRIIKNEAGQPVFVVLPYAEYERLQERAEIAEEIAEFGEAVNADEEALPAELVRRLIGGEKPLKVYYEYRALSQTELAGMTELTPAYISQLESGARAGSLKALKRLADALKVDVDDLT